MTSDVCQKVLFLFLQFNHINLKYRKERIKTQRNTKIFVLWTMVWMKQMTLCVKSGDIWIINNNSDHKQLPLTWTDWFYLFFPNTRLKVQCPWAAATCLQTLYICWGSFGSCLLKEHDLSCNSRWPGSEGFRRPLQSYRLAHVSLCLLSELSMRGGIKVIKLFITDI